MGRTRARWGGCTKSGGIAIHGNPPTANTSKSELYDHFIGFPTNNAPFVQIRG